MMQETALSMSRNPTARTSPERSAQKERTLARFSSPGLMVTTRKIAERVSGEETSCETAVSGADGGALMGSDAIGVQPAAADSKLGFLCQAVQGGNQRNRQLIKRR